MAQKKRKPRQKGAPVPMVSIDGIELLPSLLQKVTGGGNVNGRGNCDLTYGMFSIPGGRAGQIGTMRMRRRTGEKGCVLKIEMTDGQCRGCAQLLNATIHCKEDDLSTPLKWEIAEEMFEGKKAVPHTKISKSGSVQDATINVVDKTGTQKIKVSGAYTINWALFDAVGRLPRRKFKPIEFDMIDHFDQLKPDNKLYYRTSQKVRFSDGEITVHMFDHFGFGIVPWTYFVNDNGLMVLAAGGLEAYGLLKAGAS